MSVSCGIRRVGFWVTTVPLLVGLPVVAQQNPGDLGPRHLQDEADKVPISAVEEFEPELLDEKGEL